jgi:hypothetical protein
MQCSERTRRIIASHQITDRKRGSESGFAHTKRRICIMNRAIDGERKRTHASIYLSTARRALRPAYVCCCHSPHSFPPLPTQAQAGFCSCSSSSCVCACDRCAGACRLPLHPTNQRTSCHHLQHRLCSVLKVWLHSNEQTRDGGMSGGARTTKFYF